MEKQELINILESYDYPPFMIEQTIDKTLKFQNDIKEAFNLWYNDNSILPDIEVEGYSFEVLITEFEMNPIGAFITLDWLQREPDTAKESLEKGYM